MVLTPFFGTYTAVLGLVGLILVMVALKGLADHYGEKGTFNNALYGVILAIVGSFVLLFVFPFYSVVNGTIVYLTC